MKALIVIISGINGARVMELKTEIILIAILLLIVAPMPVCAQASPHVQGSGLAAGGGSSLGCPGCPGCPDNPVRNPNEPACY